MGGSGAAAACDEERSGRAPAVVAFEGVGKPPQVAGDRLELVGIDICGMALGERGAGGRAEPGDGDIILVGPAAGPLDQLEDILHALGSGSGRAGGAAWRRSAESR